MATNVGIIAEDRSDIEVLQLLIRKLAKKPFKVLHFVGRGCGKINSKCRAWAENLQIRGCRLLILIHDSDDKNVIELHQNLQVALNPCPVKLYLIVVAVRELESWLLADHAAISSAFSIKPPIGKVANPESIARPKEHLRDMIYLKSKKKVRYINTVHNKIIASKITPLSLRRCQSFIPLELFVKQHL